jgi:DNA polymerase-3 subunit delta'
VEQILDLQAKLSRARYEGKYRAALIDRADKLTIEANNALLRLAEEPPPATVLVLSVDNGEAVLPTLRSRAQMVYFPAEPAGGAVSEDALALAGGDAALAHEISAAGGEKVADWLARYEAVLSEGDFLKVLTLAAELEREEIRLMLTAFAARLSAEIADGRGRPDRLVLVKKALDDLRHNVNQRLVLEVLTLRVIGAAEK